MITIFVTRNLPYIHEMRIDEKSLMQLPTGAWYRVDLGCEGTAWHRKLGKARESVRQWKAVQIKALKSQILKVKGMPITVIKS